MLLLQQLLCLMVDVDWMEHGERQYLVGEVELDGENEREERMEEVGEGHGGNEKIF